MLIHVRISDRDAIFDADTGIVYTSDGYGNCVISTPPERVAGIALATNTPFQQIAVQLMEAESEEDDDTD